MTTPDTAGFDWRYVLYRFYDTGRRLLYVGRTNDITARFPGHRSDKSWWSEVADCKVEFFPDYAALKQAELVAIRTEHPVYNIVGRPRATRPPAEELPIMSYPQINSEEQFTPAQTLELFTDGVVVDGLPLFAYPQSTSVRMRAGSDPDTGEARNWVEVAFTVRIMASTATVHSGDDESVLDKMTPEQRSNLWGMSPSSENDCSDAPTEALGLRSVDAEESCEQSA